jgi:hypothetical protein
MATALTVAAITAITPPLTPNDIRVVTATEVALVVVHQSVKPLSGNHVGSSVAKQDGSGKGDISVVIDDFITGGVIQVVRNRLLDATSNPRMRQAIIGFFPDEVTDSRGGPLTVLQRRLVAAAKGNTTVIALVSPSATLWVVGRSWDAAGRVVGPARQFTSGVGRWPGRK